ncbi:MAG: glucosamine-6-phosphate deaminase [Deferribacteraceae bacterium]|jgi:glucosamine-6-phosphate deaminase|nr:glucosamine-6-phosphate deaminase [Deferribacteraceae bacterium]
MRKLSFSVEIHDTRAAMGKAAGERAEALLLAMLQQKEELRLIAASAPSQNEVLAYLVQSKRIDWSRITAFHMDEYIGLPADAPQNFGNWLKERFFGKLPFKDVHYLRGDADEITECKRYAALLKAAPIDMLLCGIGENGHIAFNDPPVADFADPHRVRVINLDEVSRMQQVHDGCFATLDAVPKTAFTLTIPILLSAAAVVCTAPGASKTAAATSMINGPIETACPASILRQHPCCHVFLDAESGPSPILARL